MKYMLHNFTDAVRLLEEGKDFFFSFWAPFDVALIEANFLAEPEEQFQTGT